MPSLLEALQRKYFTDYERDNHHPLTVKTTVTIGANNNNTNSNCNGDSNSHNSHGHGHSHSPSHSHNPNKIHNNSNNNNGHNQHESKRTLVDDNQDVNEAITVSETVASAAAITVTESVSTTATEKATKITTELKTKSDAAWPSPSPSESEESEGNRLISIFVPRIPPLLCVPQLLVLNDCDIDCAGNFDSIRDKCRNVRELDLAQNKLNDWNEIFQIIQHMPHIEFLNLSRNHLSDTLIKTPNIMPIQNLRGIVLNGTYLNWQSIEILLRNLPILTELHLSLNNYNEISIDLSTEHHHHHQTDENNSEADDDDCKLNCTKHMLPHKALKILHFTSNPIEKWTEICRLGRIFPNLEKLVLAKCPLTSLTCNTKCHDEPSADTEKPSVNLDCAGGGDGVEGGGGEGDGNGIGVGVSVSVGAVGRDDNGEKIFQNLQYLNLNCTSIDKWENVDYLAKYPKLNTLWVKNWPLWDQLECTEHERRQLLIARLPNVQILNGGGIITPDEREDAERSFIRYYMDKPEMERPQQRYMDLIAKHGQLEPLVNINLKPDKRIKIFLTYHDKREARMVDVYRTVGDLKVKLERIVGLAANQMRLYYVDQDYKDFGPEEMRFPNKFLYSYNIQPGDEIIVDVKKKKRISTSESDQQI